MKSLRSLGKAFATPTALLAAAAVIATSAPLASVSTATTQGISHEVTTASNYDVALATKVLMLNGTKVPFIYNGQIQNTLQGALCTGVFECEVVKYDNFIISFTPQSAKVALLNTTLQAQTEDVVVAGYSQGASIIIALLMARANGSLPPGVVHEDFILMGNPNHPLNGIAKVPEYDNPYSILNIAREYDGFADFPNNPFNLLAVANAMSGIFAVHTDYESVDINSPDNLFYQDPNDQTKTYILVPTKTLPLLQSLRNFLEVFGLEGIVDDTLNPWLKPIVDSAYDRSMYEEATPEVESQEEVAPTAARVTMTEEPSLVSLDSSAQGQKDDSSEKQPVTPVVSTLVEKTPIEQPEQSLPVTGNDQQVVKTGISEPKPEVKVEVEEEQDQPSQQKTTQRQPSSTVNDEPDSKLDKDDSVTEGADDQDNDTPKRRFSSSQSESNSPKNSVNSEPTDTKPSSDSKKSSASDSNDNQGSDKRDHKDSE